MLVLHEQGHLLDVLQLLLVFLKGFLYLCQALLHDILVEFPHVLLHYALHVLGGVSYL